MTLTLEKPVRTYVTITDGRTKKSIHRTVYGATPDQIAEILAAAGNKPVSSDATEQAKRPSRKSTAA